MELLIAIFVVGGIIVILELISIHGAMTRNTAILTQQREELTKVQDFLFPLYQARRPRRR